MEIKLPQADVSSKKLDTYRIRQLILLIADILIITSSIIISMMLTQANIKDSNIITIILIYLLFEVTSLIVFKAYSSLWKDSGDREIVAIAIAALVYVLPISWVYKTIGYEFSILFYVVNTLFILSLTCGSRIIYRGLRRFKGYVSISKDEKADKVLVVGAGDAGSLIIRELYQNPQLGKRPVAIIDDNINKLNTKIHNIPVVGTTKEIKEIVKQYEVDEIILSIAKISAKNKKEILEACKETKCKVKIIPGIFEIIDGKVDVKKIRNVEIEDLLGRDPVKIDLKEISGYVKNKTVLVTGGGGSIGSELCRQIAKTNPKKLILLDIYENGAYDIQQELIRKHKDKLNLEVIIASVRDEKRLESLFIKYKPQVVFHAAAHKHVPLMEKSPCEAIKNNIFGTTNVAMMAHKYNVKRFVLISTDKAVNPTNIMGATKRAAEMVVQTLNEKSKTEFVAVRFGNVLGSNGSVIPLFKQQIEEGGPVIVTHREITRFFMTIPEAVSLVMQAGAMAKGGEIFVLDMGESVKIIDLANNLISLSGFEPNVDIKIEFSGLRPGEKMYEEVLMDEEGLKETHHNKIRIGKPIVIDEQRLQNQLNKLKNVVEKEQTELIESLMQELVPTFVREEYSQDEIKATS